MSSRVGDEMASGVGFGPWAVVWRHCSDVCDAILIYLALQLPFFARNAWIFNAEWNFAAFRSGTWCAMRGQ